jgi:uncharacterized protein YjbJ (UPF0337 family)
MTRRTSRQRWSRTKSQVRHQWNRLTDDDIERVKGNADRLVEALCRRYNYNHWLAEREIAAWRQMLVRLSS